MPLPLILLISIAIYGAAVLYVRFRAMPEGTNYCGPERWIEEGEISFLSDLTWWENGKRVSRHNIFEEVRRAVSGARKFIIIDMFLFIYGSEGAPWPPVTRRLTELLVRKKSERPEMKIFLITDPLNNAYGNYKTESLQRLETAGIPVIVTDIDKLRDCNIFYGAFWRLFLKWWGTGRKGWLRHPLDERKNRVTVRAFLKALNARANHRKAVIADDGDGYVTIISSANIHESSVWHSNIAFKIKGPLAKDVLRTENAVAGMSGCEISAEIKDRHRPGGDVKVQLLTEAPIGRSLLRDLGRAGEGDRIYLAMFYLSEKRIVRALLEACRRGALIDCVLDQNHESFNKGKIGLPNEISAEILRKKGGGRIRLRWCASRSEQFHAKLMAILSKGYLTVYGGSANFTRRNIGGFTLEMCLRAEAPARRKFCRDILEYFDFICKEPFSIPAHTAPAAYGFKHMVFQAQHLLQWTTY